MAIMTKGSVTSPTRTKAHQGRYCLLLWDGMAPQERTCARRCDQHHSNAENGRAGHPAANRRQYKWEQHSYPHGPQKATGTSPLARWGPEGGGESTLAWSISFVSWNQLRRQPWLPTNHKRDKQEQRLSLQGAQFVEGAGMSQAGASSPLQQRRLAA